MQKMQQTMDNNKLNVYLIPGLITDQALIMHEVSNYFQVDLSTICQGGRYGKYVIIKRIVSYLLAYQNYINTSGEHYNADKISALLNLDHTTIVYYIKTSDCIYLNPDIREHLAVLLQKLNINLNNFKSIINEIKSKHRTRK